jgi:predicted dehydrogenase
MNRRDTTNRRQFLRQSAVTSAALAAPYFVPARLLGGGAEQPNERLAIGVIGVGGMGLGHLDWLLGRSDAEVVAIADVDAAHRQKALDAVHAKKPNAECAAYNDFRELLVRPDVDAVFIVTPDHWHALIGIAAAEAGKDIYCEKPLVNSIGEGRKLCDAIKKSGRILQCGSHERSNPNIRYAAELVQSGKLGEVKTVRVSMPFSDPHHQEVRSRQIAPVPADVPAGFDYDFWLGPTENVPYADKRCHFWWRFNNRYGGGEMTDRGAHIIDLAQLALGRDDAGPVHFNAHGTALTGGLYDAFFDFEFENQYADGVRIIGEKTGPRGLRFEGTEGWVFANIHGGKLEAEPASLLTEPKHHESVDAYAIHRQNFFDSVRSRQAPHATAEIGHRTATICHVNNLSMRLGRPLTWDPVAERFVGDDEANAHLMPAMREPWHV